VRARGAKIGAAALLMLAGFDNGAEELTGFDIHLFVAYL